MKGNVGVLVRMECEAGEMALVSTGEVQEKWLLATWKLPMRREACEGFLGGDWEWKERERARREEEREEEDKKRKAKEAEKAKRKRSHSCPKCPKCK